MNNQLSEKNKVFKLLYLCLTALVILLFVLVLTMPDSASAEYKYTIETIFQICLPISAIGAIICFLLYKGSAGIKDLLNLKTKMFYFLGIGILLVYIPVLSPDSIGIDWKYGILFSLCWFVGTLLLALGLFSMAARINNIFSGLLCFIASLSLAFSVCEFAFLCTSQTMDGRFVATDRSKHVKSGEANAVPSHEKNAIGTFSVRPDNASGAFAHTEWRFDKPLFDAKYTFDRNNRRIMPKADEHPKADLLVFGCSFTFGYGLEDEQTWPYKLAELLGPTWLVENYGQNGFGAQQMLGMIEDKKIDVPDAPVRQALFLAIRDQIRRNSGLFLMDSITYREEDGKLVRGERTSDSKLMFLFRLPKIFNGSQFVRETCRMVMYKLAAIMNSRHTELYVAMLAESAKLLRDHYQTALTVLLWPDIENIATVLEDKGISVLFARKMLKNWGEGDSPNYHIVPHLESHPNEQATTEIARGLAEYYAKMTQ